jgi:hypothetical protein
VAAGVWLRLQQHPFHQNLWAIDWLGYYEDQARDLYNLNLLSFLFRWEGLHPPLSGTIHGAMMVAGLGLPVHWAATIAASLAAPLILGLAGARRHGLGALLLGTAWVSLSPLQANYGLNTTPYPWLLLFVAGSTVATLRALETGDKRHFLAAGILSALAIQVHVLAFAVVLAQALVLIARGKASRPSRGSAANRWWLLVAASAMVLSWHAVQMTGDSWTFHVSEAGGGWTGEVALALANRFGAWSDKYLLIAVVALGILGGLAQGPRTAIALLLLEGFGTLCALVLFYEVNVADPRLVHYFAMPQMLLLCAGAWGLAALARSFDDRRRGGAVLALAAVLSLPWLWNTLEWNQQRQDRAREAIAASSAARVHDLYSSAGEGDVIAYLWDNRFLNDESDHLDPIASGWPTWRLGRPCLQVEMPPHHCNQHDGSYFFFSPSAQTGRDGDAVIPFESMEEGFRRLINLSTAPGRTVIVVSAATDAPPRPWPMESWLLSHGATIDEPEPDGMLTITLPVGLRVEPPPPLHD